MMTKEAAIDTLIANACCDYTNLCHKCPWYNTKDCDDTSFSDVILEAINMLIGEDNNGKNDEIIRY